MGPDALIFTLKAAFMDVLCPLLPSNLARGEESKNLSPEVLCHTQELDITG
jgi:hypothetical protein